MSTVDSKDYNGLPLETVRCNRSLASITSPLSWETRPWKKGLVATKLTAMAEIKYLSFMISACIALWANALVHHHYQQMVTASPLSTLSTISKLYLCPCSDICLQRLHLTLVVLFYLHQPNIAFLLIVMLAINIDKDNENHLYFNYWNLVKCVFNWAYFKFKI